MKKNRVDNVHIRSEKPLVPPAKIKAALPLTPELEQRVLRAREAVRAVLDGKDARRLAIVGPCSIHNVKSGLEYAGRLARLADAVRDTFVVIMRVYFEKPRTVVGWKGLINDPRQDGSFRIEEGLHKARKFLLDVTALGLPAGTEALDPIVPQYIADAIAWSTIGARTTESQVHRELASGLSSPVGFKNGTDGNIDTAINAIQSAAHPHNFLGITQDGRTAVFRTQGNRHAHIILRGGSRPNYDSASIAFCQEKLRQAGLPQNIVVDCSHGNSSKNHTRQPAVFDDCVRQIENGNRSIVGLMLESNLVAGHWSPPSAVDPSQPPPFGLSVTDACIDWETTEALLLDGASRLRPVIAARRSA